MILGSFWYVKKSQNVYSCVNFAPAVFFRLDGQKQGSCLTFIWWLIRIVNKVCGLLIGSSKLEVFCSNQKVWVFAEIKFCCPLFLIRIWRSTMFLELLLFRSGSNVGGPRHLISQRHLHWFEPPPMLSLAASTGWIYVQFYKLPLFFKNVTDENIHQFICQPNWLK